jgi:hypothetical protein
MDQYEHIVHQPVFFLFIAFSFLLTFGYFWGRRHNRNISMSALENLVTIVKPDDQTFTNIGGAIGYHANLFVKRKGAAISRVDATLTMLPRHSWLYMPISKITRRYDRFFITLFLKRPPPEEAHLIEGGYSRFKGSKIANARRLKCEDILWGELPFFLYYESTAMRDRIMGFVADNPDPGTVRHIALVPEQKKSFIFMIPKRGSVARYLAPIYRWIPSAVKS